LIFINSHFITGHFHIHYAIIEGNYIDTLIIVEFHTPYWLIADSRRFSFRQLSLFCRTPLYCITDTKNDSIADFLHCICFLPDTEAIFASRIRLRDYRSDG